MLHICMHATYAYYICMSVLHMHTTYAYYICIVFSVTYYADVHTTWRIANGVSCIGYAGHGLTYVMPWLVVGLET